MKYRMDLDGVETERPRLVGLWIEGFSWIVGGAREGEVTITGELEGDPREPLQILRDLREEQLSRRPTPVWPVGKDD